MKTAIKKNGRVKFVRPFFRYCLVTVSLAGLSERRTRSLGLSYKYNLILWQNNVWCLFTCGWAIDDTDEIDDLVETVYQNKTTKTTKNVSYWESQALNENGWPIKDVWNNCHQTHIRSSACTRWFTTSKISKLTLCFLLNRETIRTVTKCKLTFLTNKPTNSTPICKRKRKPQNLSCWDTIGSQYSWHC